MKPVNNAEQSAAELVEQRAETNGNAKWQKHGMKALEKCAKNQPVAFCKMYVLLVPREMKVEHSQGIASLTDEQIETAIAAIREMLDKREKALAGEVIEGKAEPVALPASGQGSQGER